jgi:hypothetical protein
MKHPLANPDLNKMRESLRLLAIMGVWVVGLSGCMHALRPAFVDVASPLHSAEVAVIAADDEIVRLRISAPNEPVFLAMVEPKVVGDGLYLFPRYISKPMVSEEVEVPVVELDLPAAWRDRIYWVEGRSAPRWYQIFKPRVETIERRRLTLPEEGAGVAGSG